MPGYIFLSHASNDKAIADQVCDLLERSGVKCWIAPRDISAEKSWSDSIMDGLARASGLIFYNP